jgi:hypothetical protein
MLVETPTLDNRKDITCKVGDLLYVKVCADLYKLGER